MVMYKNKYGSMINVASYWSGNETNTRTIFAEA